MRFLSALPPILALALISSACSNISTHPRSTQTGDRLSSGLRSEAPGYETLSGGSPLDADPSEMISDSSTPFDPSSAPSSSHPDASADSKQSGKPEQQEQQQEEASKNKEIEVPVVNLADSEISNAATGEASNSCKDLSGIAGKWNVFKGASSLQSATLTLIQDQDGVKTYSATTISTQAGLPQNNSTSNEAETQTVDETGAASPTFVASYDVVNSTIQFNTRTCMVSIQKDLQDSHAHYRIESDPSSDGAFVLKKCKSQSTGSATEMGNACGETGERISYLPKTAP